jgi:hypothetical protein
MPVDKSSGLVMRNSKVIIFCQGTASQCVYYECHLGHSSQMAMASSMARWRTFRFCALDSGAKAHQTGPRSPDEATWVRRSKVWMDDPKSVSGVLAVSARRAISTIGHHNKWTRTWPPFQRWRWIGMLNLDNFTLFLGCLAVCVVEDRESYGSDRCSVLVLTGIFKFLLLFLSAWWKWRC